MCVWGSESGEKYVARLDIRGRGSLMSLGERTKEKGSRRHWARGSRERDRTHYVILFSTHYKVQFSPSNSLQPYTYSCSLSLSLFLSLSLSLSLLLVAVPYLPYYSRSPFFLHCILLLVVFFFLDFIKMDIHLMIF